jgi:hypothetical protein
VHESVHQIGRYFALASGLAAFFNDKTGEDELVQAFPFSQNSISPPAPHRGCASRSSGDTTLANWRRVQMFMTHRNRLRSTLDSMNSVWMQSDTTAIVFIARHSPPQGLLLPMICCRGLNAQASHGSIGFHHFPAMSSRQRLPMVI